MVAGRRGRAPDGGAVARSAGLGGRDRRLADGARHAPDTHFRSDPGPRPSGDRPQQGAGGSRGAAARGARRAAAVLRLPRTARGSPHRRAPAAGPPAAGHPRRDSFDHHAGHRVAGQEAGGPGGRREHPAAVGSRRASAVRGRRRLLGGGAPPAVRRFGGHLVLGGLDDRGGVPRLPAGGRLRDPVADAPLRRPIRRGRRLHRCRTADGRQRGPRVGVRLAVVHPPRVGRTESARDRQHARRGDRPRAAPLPPRGGTAVLRRIAFLRSLCRATAGRARRERPTDAAAKRAADHRRLRPASAPGGRRARVGFRPGDRPRCATVHRTRRAAGGGRTGSARVPPSHPLLGQQHARISSEHRHPAGGSATGTRVAGTGCRPGARPVGRITADARSAQRRRPREARTLERPPCRGLAAVAAAGPGRLDPVSRGAR